MKKEDIEILNYETFYKDNSKLIGFVDIRIPKLCNFEIHHIAHIQSGKGRWFNFPNYKKDTVSGTEYRPYAKFKENVHNEELLELLSEPVKEFCYKNGIAIPDAPKPIEFSENLPF